MRLAKIFAVLAAVFLVGAVAIATLGSPDLSLGEALTTIDAARLAATERFVRLHLSAWMWDRPVKALFARPVWMVPAALGLIFAGAAFTAANNGNALKSRHRRS